jgi:hypothetical protein
MKIFSLLGWLLLLIALVAIGATLPDIIRYLKIRSM